jgi:hypothetical protein
MAKKLSRTHCLIIWVFKHFCYKLVDKKAKFISGFTNLFLQIIMLLCDEHTLKKFGYFCVLRPKFQQVGNIVM